MIVRGLPRFAILALIPGVVFAYEVETHEELSQAAAFASVLAQPETFMRLGLQGTINDPSLTLPSPQKPDDKKTVRLLIRDGARFEDGFTPCSTRPKHHFFDPTSGGGLNTVFATGTPSPDWALEDQQDQSGQENSYQDARQYFHDALTNASGTDTDRNASWGRLFQTLGQIVHHVQDMAQPQHVRNDIHLTFEDCGVVVQWAGKPIESPSLYEDYTKIKGASGGLDVLYGAYPPVNTLGLDSQFLAVPRQFWINGGLGLAEYTNTNFVSKRTNLDTDKYTSPALSNALGSIKSANALLAAKGKPIPAQCLPPNPDCVMEFIGTPVIDGYRGESSWNEYTSTFSIFDQDLVIRGKRPVYSLNEFNFDAAHEFLIPRAVGYSAGLLNYFFRGRLEAGSTDGALRPTVDSLPRSNA